MAVLGITNAMGAGHRQLQSGTELLKATRLAESLIEEVRGRPYDGTGTGRTLLHVDDYDGFDETAGALCDFSGNALPVEYQAFSRQSKVMPSMKTLEDLGGAVVNGKTIVVIIRDSQNQILVELSSFIAESLP